MYLSNYPISIKLGVIYVCYTNLCKYTLAIQSCKKKYELDYIPISTYTAENHK